MELTVITTDFGCYYPDYSVSRKLAKLPRTRSGRPDHRFKSSRVAARYERAVERYCRALWCRGEGGRYTSPVRPIRFILARLRLKKFQKIS